MTTEKNTGGEVVLYQAEDGKASIDVRLDHETVWLTQDQMSKLFERTFGRHQALAQCFSRRRIG